MADVNKFVLLTDEELADLLDGADAVNTKKQIKYAIGRLEAFAKFTGTRLDAVEGLDVKELDQFLSRFYGGLRKNDGSLYTKKSMFGIRYGLHRHFQSTRELDITNSNAFKESNNTYKAVMVKLKREGKGAVQHKKEISEDDMAKILDSLDITTPEGLQGKVFIDIMIYFANRGRENLRDMKASDFEVHVDEHNLRYLVHQDTLTKCRRENDDETYSGHMYEIPGSPRCPLTNVTFLAFKDVLNPGQECMWQRPKPKAPTDGSPWYSNAPLGVNTLGNKMKQIAKKAGCTVKYTNHCLRATACSVLDEAGFESRHIMSITGHKSESSLKHYSRTSDNKKKLMSATIAAQMKENMPTKDEVPVPVNVEEEQAGPLEVAKQPMETDMNVVDNVADNVLTNSQEQLFLSEFNIQNQMATSTVQHFHFHGPVNFYNKT